MKETAKVLVIAHRGWSGAYPENTLLAFRKAIELGAPMIELDVTLSSDRRPIVIHDETLDRTTNGQGPVGQWKLDQLLELDAGSWFDPAYSGLRLPLLDEVLQLVSKSPAQVNIEIKPECYDDSAKPDSIEEQVLELVTRYRLKERVLVSSFHWPFLKRIKARDALVRTALLYEGEVSDLKLAELKKEYACEAVNPWWVKLNRDFVDRAHDQDLKVFTFTVNTLREMELALHLGVDGIFTNYPGRMLSALPDFAARTNQMDLAEKKADQAELRAAAESYGRDA